MKVVAWYSHGNSPTDSNHETKNTLLKSITDKENTHAQGSQGLGKDSDERIICSQ